MNILILAEGMQNTDMDQDRDTEEGPLSILYRQE